MASAPPSFGSSKETTNYARLCRLLVDVGSQALRDTFDRFHPPASLHQDLTHPPAHPILQSLKKKRILNATQWGKLFPAIPASVSSANFDITLLMLLLRNICGLSPPASTGSWDTLPPSSDVTTEAYIARVRLYRNIIYGHASQASVDDSTFNSLWQYIRNTLVGLGAGACYGAAIDKLKVESMDLDVEEHYRELLKEWKRDGDNTKEKLLEIEEMLRQWKMEDDNSKEKLSTKMEEMLQQWQTVEGHSKDKLVELEEMLIQWKKEEGSAKLKDKGEIEEMLKMLKADERTTKDELKKIQEMLNRLTTGEGNIENKFGKVEESFDPNEFIDGFRKLYKIREGWLAPFPWCEEFGFHLDSIFIRLKMVSRKKERGTKTDDIVDMFDIFKPHEECPRPTRVLIEGKPGMGKTTYCQKLVYDWATGRQVQLTSFPIFEVVLLLKCREIKSGLWEAIDDQLLPLDVKEEDRERFFEFVRHNQSSVLLVLDGLDELPSGKLKEIIQGRMLSKCHLVATARYEAGIKVRGSCDTLLEIEGFTEEDAENFIIGYFKDMENLAQKLLNELDKDQSLWDLAANPLNTALLCLLCDDLKGIFPENRTLIFLEIIRCVLRRHRRKNELQETDEDLTELYKAELKQLGKIALSGLNEDDMYFEASQFPDRRTDTPGFGFLSVQPGSSKRRPSLRYGFLHKSFQEFFAAFYLCCQLLDGEISADNVVGDASYFDDLKQVLLFTVGLMAVQSEEKAKEFIKGMATLVNSTDSNDFLLVVLDCINECKKENTDLHKELARLLGSLLEIKNVSIVNSPHAATSLIEALQTNSTLRWLDLSDNSIGDGGCAAMAEALKTNSTLTWLNLSDNSIGDGGCAAMAEALQINSTLPRLYLSGNSIGDGGCAAMAEALQTNSTLTRLDLSHNSIGDGGCAVMAEALQTNSTLTLLDLSHNSIGDGGCAAMAPALQTNSTLTELDLSHNSIGDVGCAAMAEALQTNSTLTELDLSHNSIGDGGCAAMAEALQTNSTLTELDLSHNSIGDGGCAAMAPALQTNSMLTWLDLSHNSIGDGGCTAMAEALQTNSTLTQLDLSHNSIGEGGCAAMAEPLQTNSTLTWLDLSHNSIGDGGCAAMAEALQTNSTLTELDLSDNSIGDVGCAAMAEALQTNSTLTELYLSHNSIGDGGCTAMAEVLKTNSTLVFFGSRGNQMSENGLAAVNSMIQV